MHAPPIDELNAVLDRVKTWPINDRISLVKGVLETFAPAAPIVPPVPRGRPVEELIGLGAGESPPPDDEQVRAWIAEHRQEKYG